MSMAALHSTGIAWPPTPKVGGGRLAAKGPPRKPGRQECGAWRFGGNDAFDFESRFGEVQDQTVLTARGPEVGANDGEVDILDTSDRLELHDDQSRHQKVQPMMPNLCAAIEDRHGELPIELNPSR
jgi:hypothetical protein